MSQEEVPRRRRRHRRVVAPATNARPEDEPDFTEPRNPLGTAVDDQDGLEEVGSDEWWRAQRPPHWG